MSLGSGGGQFVQGEQTFIYSFVLSGGQICLEGWDWGNFGKKVVLGVEG